MEEGTIEQYIKDGKISIGKEDWAALNAKYDKEEIKTAMIAQILAGNVKFPYNEITIEDASDSFKKLCAYQCRPMKKGSVMTRYEYKYPLGNLYIDETLVGNDASNFFHQQARALASGHGDPCPWDVWHSERYLNSALKPLWTLKMDHIDNKCFRSAIALRRYWASQFRPAVAKSIYEKFRSVDVLDFSSGWGDRLCGFYAAPNTRSYIGIDPNKMVYDNYYKQVDLYKTLTTEKKTTFYNEAAEDVVLEPNIVDTVFTSPPYFCAETYTKDPNQSWVRYNERDAWLRGFMFKTLDNVWRALKPGGYLVINISDVHRKNKVQKICDPMNEYIKHILGGKYLGGFGMKMSRRPASGAYKQKDGVCVEPVWTWKKEG